MNKFSLNISVQKGKIVLNRQKVADYFANLKDGEYSLFVSSNEKDNKRYRGHFGRILKLIITQGEIEERLKVCKKEAEFILHESCKLRFSKTPIIDPFTGEVLSLKGGSTTLMNDTEFNEFQEEVMAYFTTEFGIDFSVLFST